MAKDPICKRNVDEKAFGLNPEKQVEKNRLN